MASGRSTNYTDIASDETFDLLCRVCKHKGKNLEAEKYCVECQDYFCSNCVKLHEALPTLTGHKILDKSQFSSGTSKKLSKGPQGSSQGQPPAPTERCNRHTHYYIDMYCQNHDSVGCATCMAVDHRLCKDTFYIPEFIQNNQSASCHGDVKQTLDTIALSLKVHYDGLQRQKDQLIKRKAEIIQEIQKFRKEINKRLDALENNSIAVIEEKYKSLVSQIEEEMKKLDASKVNVKSAQDKIGPTCRNVSQDFLNAHKGKNIASNASQCIEDSKACTPTQDVDFTPDQRIPALLRELDSLGRITHTSTGTTEATATSDVQSQNKGNQTYAGTGKTQHPDALLQDTGNQTYSGASKTQKPDALLQATGNQSYFGAGKTQHPVALLQATGNQSYFGAGKTQHPDALLQATGNQSYFGAGKTQHPDALLQATGNQTYSGAGKTQHPDALLQATGNQTSSGTGKTQHPDALLQATGNQTYSGAGKTQQPDALLQATGNQTSSGTGKTQQPDALLQAKGSKKYCVKVKSDKKGCDIINACTLEDGTIILSDYNNNNLKRLDSSTFAVRDYYDLPGTPWQVCTISRQEVAVSLPLHKVVQFISVGSRMTKTKEIKTDFWCYGLAYGNGRLYLSDSDTSVYIYSISGSKLQQYSRDQSGQRLFSDIMSLAVSKDGSMIYVCDAYKGLIVLDSHGKVVGQYNGPQLQQACDCYLTTTGSILVCGSSSYNVLQFGPNGDFRNEVLKFKDKKVSYKAIYCNHQMSKMLIGGTQNDIEVYDLVKQGI